MQWYDWKFWRFAWTSHVEPYRLYGVDGDGAWVRVIGCLWWLRKPRNVRYRS